MTKVVDDTRARQATLGRPVLYVLIASLLLAGIYLGTMTIWSGMTSSDTHSKNQQALEPRPAVPPDSTGSTKQSAPAR